MRLRRVCVTSMEKQLNDLTVLTKYQNRQVILNYYQEEDMLYHKDGFQFTTIQLEEDQLTFNQNNGTITTFNLKTYPEKYINTAFQNYYSLKNDSGRLEIYFP